MLSTGMGDITKRRAAPRRFEGAQHLTPRHFRSRLAAGMGDVTNLGRVGGAGLAHLDTSGAAAIEDCLVPIIVKL